MSHITRLAVVFTAALLPLACSTTPTGQPTGARPEIIFDDVGGIWQPAMGIDKGNRPPIPDGQRYLAAGPFEVNMREVPRAELTTPDLQGLEQRRGGGRIESPLPDDVVKKLRDDARFLHANPLIQEISESAVTAPSLATATAGTGFPSVDYPHCCGGGGNVPPDPELAAGPNHVIAVVNVAFEIFNTSGVSQGGVRTFASFFSGVPGCTGVFDPNANYDEAADRFILGIDGDGGSYCIAVSQTADPTGPWYRYSFQTASRRDFFDYPHAGVGDDAIYLGANIFGPFAFKEGRIWAIDKFDMYAGSAPTVVSFSTGNDGTPQPVNLHGFNQGTWPTGGPHYILTDGASFNGVSYGVWSWSNPFAGGVPVKKPSEVNLNAATGITAGMPVDAPQAGGGTLQANDFRGQDAEYRNGHIWMSNAQSCNPGGGTVNCVRWAEIDPVGPSVVHAGVHATNGQYRSFPDLAVDHCGNMMMGYSKTSSSSNPGVYAIGRDSSGTFQTEITVKAAEGVYVAFDGAPYRWGDYTEMTIAPDGSTFWYLGEYAKNTGTNNGKWGTWVNSFTFGCNAGGNAPPVAVIADPVCNLLSCNFDGSGSTDDTGIKSFAWNFGDGATSSSATPQHSYAAKGTYAVSLTVTDVDNATDTANYSLTVDDGVNIPPNAVITSIVCNNTTRNCVFNGSGSNDSDGSITSWVWDFGDTTSGSGETTSHTYAAYGNYTARLTVTDNDLDTDFAESGVTLTDPGPVTTMSVASVFVDTLNLSGGSKSPRATVTIQDNLGNAVASVLVKGAFTGDAEDPSTQDTTDSSGSAVLVSSASKKGKVKFTFCVTDVSGGALSWDGEKPCASN